MIEFQALWPHAIMPQKKRSISIFTRVYLSNHGLIRTYLNLKPTFQRKNWNNRGDVTTLMNGKAHTRKMSVLKSRSVHLCNLNKNPSRIFCRFIQVTFKNEYGGLPCWSACHCRGQDPRKILMPRAAEPVSHNEGHTLSLQLEGALTQQRRPNTAEKKQFINLKIF